MGVDEDREHAERLVVLDETHSAHVRREVVDLRCAVDHDRAIACPAEVEFDALSVVVDLVPVPGWLDVRCPYSEALVEQTTDEMSSDEAPATRDDHEISHQ